MWVRDQSCLGDFHNISIKMKHFDEYLDFCFKAYSDFGRKKITDNKITE